MITLKSKREIDAMEESGALLASIHVQLRDFIKPGVTTWDIDQFVQKKIEEEAEKMGIKKKTLWNAKKELEIESVKIGNQWFWMLPE